MKNWRGHIEATAIPIARDVMANFGIETLWVGADFRNAVVCAVVPEDVDLSREDEVCAAVREATGVDLNIEHPPTYPFTLHLTPPLGPVDIPDLDADISEHEFDSEELSGFNDAVARLGALAGEYDFVATFAMGGMGPLGWIVERIKRPEQSQYGCADDWQAANMQWLAQMQAKFHIFGGLSWDVGAAPQPKATYKAWLSSLPANSRVLVFDTTYTGNGCNKAVKETRLGLTTRTTGLRVRVVGIFDTSRKRRVPGPRSESRLNIDGSECILETAALPVQRLITEDQNELIGHTALRESLGLSAHWNASLVLVLRGPHLVYANVVTAVAGHLEELARRDQWGPPLTSDSAWLQVAAGLAATIGNAKQAEWEGANKAYGSRLLTEQELLDERKVIAARKAAMRKRVENLLSRW